MKTFREFLSEANREELPTQQEVADYLAKYYPKEQENKLFDDNWGLYSNNKNAIVSKILLCTTATREVVNLFKKNKYDLLVSHHDNIVKVPQIIFHSIMDEAKAGHNMYFAKRMGLQNVKQGTVTVQGHLYKSLTIDEFLVYLNKHGFSVEGVVQKNSQEPISSVIYCSGLGGMLINNGSLEGMNWVGKNEFDLRNKDIDVYVTGEIIQKSDLKNTNFKYIVELSHTTSEKPLFKWIKIQLMNRWRNLQVDIALNDIDYFGRDKLYGRGEREE